MSLADIEIPARLPVSHLSVSSIRTLKRCPERWRRRYLERSYEPVNGPMVIGKAVGGAETTNYGLKILTGTDLPLADVLDAYADEWHEHAQEDVFWGADKPDELRASGQKALEAYHLTVAPSVAPSSVEREFKLRFDGCEWAFTGYIDVETRDQRVRDLKVKGKRMSQADADSDPQPTAYLLARREEHRAGHGEPAAGFDFDTMVRTKTPYAEVLSTARTDVQLDAFLHRIYAAAAEIAWRCEFECWDGAPPGAWWCSQKSCGYWSSCPFGGAR